MTCGKCGHEMVQPDGHLCTSSGMCHVKGPHKDDECKCLRGRPLRVQGSATVAWDWKSVYGNVTIDAKSLGLP